MISHLSERKVLIHKLPDLVSGLNIQGDACNHTQSTQTDDGATEGFAVFITREFHYIALAIHEFEGRHSRGEVAILFAGSMRSRADGPGYRDMGK